MRPVFLVYLLLVLVVPLTAYYGFYQELLAHTFWKGGVPCDMLTTRSRMRFRAYILARDFPTVHAYFVNQYLPGFPSDLNALQGYNTLSSQSWVTAYQGGLAELHEHYKLLAEGVRERAAVKDDRFYRMLMPFLAMPNAHLYLYLNTLGLTGWVTWPVVALSFVSVWYTWPY